MAEPWVKDPTPPPSKPNVAIAGMRLNWFHIVLGVIIGVLLIIAGFLAYQGMQKPKRSPSVTVTNQSTSSASPSATPSAEQ